VRFIGTIMEPKFRLAGTPQFHSLGTSQKLCTGFDFPFRTI
jgi:hypothetical protein